jgi:aspartokinase
MPLTGSLETDICPPAGASEINISCVIEERDADRALNIIHTSMFTFLE